MDLLHPVPMLLVEVACVIVGAPLAGVLVVTRRHRSGAWAIARPVMASAGLLVVTFSLVALAGRAPIEARPLAASHAVLWAAAVALGAIGAVCASVVREPLDAAGCAMGIALTASAGLFASGPALEHVPRALLNVALLANPVVATAAAAGIDLFRTDLLYQLSPLAHTQFDYPTAGAAFVSYVLLALLLFLGAARRRSRRATAFSLERMSA